MTIHVIAVAIVGVTTFSVGISEHFATYHAGRECIFPEVNRNMNIGELGVNMNSQVFRQYLSRMAFNQELVSLSAITPCTAFCIWLEAAGVSR